MAVVADGYGHQECVEWSGKSGRVPGCVRRRWLGHCHSRKSSDVEVSGNPPRGQHFGNVVGSVMTHELLVVVAVSRQLSQV